MHLWTNFCLEVVFLWMFKLWAVKNTKKFLPEFDPKWSEKFFFWPEKKIKNPRPDPRRKKTDPSLLFTILYKEVNKNVSDLFTLCLHYTTYIGLFNKDNTVFIAPSSGIYVFHFHALTDTGYLCKIQFWVKIAFSQKKTRDFDLKFSTDG